MPISSNTAVLTRGVSRADGTAGKMVLRNSRGQYLEQDILELSNLLNAPSVSRFDEGAYLCQLTYSNAFKRKLYILRLVNGRTGIRFHRGNYAGIKTRKLKSDSAGCLLQGYGISYDYAKYQQIVTNSKQAELDMIAFFKGEDFVLIVQ